MARARDTPLWWDDEAHDARGYVDQHYAKRARLGDWHLYERRSPDQPAGAQN